LRQGFAPRRVRLTERQSATLARRAGLAAGEVESFDRLKIPFSVSGLVGRGLDELRAAAKRENLDIIPYTGSGSTDATTQPGGPIRPGDNFAATLSYGDVTAAGVGTATAVCNGRVLAFGHPFFFEGATKIGANHADAITIWKDPVFGPFKLANITEFVGTVDQDRLAGIRALVGNMPTTVPITSTVTATNTNRTREGRTDSVLNEAIPFLTFTHMFQNIDVTYDEIGEGSSSLTWKVTGTTESGLDWELNRDNMYVSDFDISFDSLWELLNQLSVLEFQEFEDIEFTGVEVSATVHEEVRQYAISDVHVARNGGRFLDVRRLRVAPGDTIRLRVVLEPYDESANKRVHLKVRVPRRVGREASLLVRGGDLFGGNFFCFFDSDCTDDFGNKIESFPDLIRAMEKAARNNEVRAQILGRRFVKAQDREALDLVVLGRKRIRLEIGR
jgi:hypothetical protein